MFPLYYAVSSMIIKFAGLRQSNEKERGFANDDVCQ